MDLRLENTLIDIAVITAKVEEYTAFYNLLEAPSKWQGTKEHPNQYAWTLGKISNSTGSFKIGLALTHEQTNVPSAIATIATFLRFKPRYVIFLGIAGSLDTNIKKGDIFIADYVHAYQYGRMKENGKFEPYMQFQEPTDQSLRTNAVTFGKTFKWWDTGIKSKEVSAHPNIYWGGLASGDSVIENSHINYFAKVFEKDNWLRAVDMESSGVALAVRYLKESGYVTGFMVLRGISDTPGEVLIETKDSKNSKEKDNNRKTRAEWTEYAANITAQFLEQFIKHSFPFTPSEKTSPKYPIDIQTKQQIAPDIFTSYQSHFLRTDELSIIHSINNEAFEQSALVTTTTLEAWWEINPLSLRIILDGSSEVIGYWQILCLSEKAFKELISGKLKEQEICYSDILSYQQLNPGSVYIYITALAASRLMQQQSASLILDLVTFLKLIHKIIGINGISAQIVSKEVLNLIRNFGMIKTNEKNGVSTWVLSSQKEIDRAVETANWHLSRLKGLIPATSQNETYSVIQLLRR